MPQEFPIDPHDRQQADSGSPREGSESFDPSSPQGQGFLPHSPGVSQHPQPGQPFEPFPQQSHDLPYGSTPPFFGEQAPRNSHRTIWIVSGVAGIVVVVVAVVAILWATGTFDSKEDKASSFSNSNSPGQPPSKTKTIDTASELLRDLQAAFVNYDREALESLLCENPTEKTRRFISNPKIDEIVQKYSGPYFVLENIGTIIKGDSTASDLLSLSLVDRIKVIEKKERPLSPFSQFSMVDLEKNNGSWCLK